jgi:hypothetical protein
MSNAKKKSSGWRPLEKRGPWRERRARRMAARTEELRRDCDRLALWRYCPVRFCRRVRSCTGDPSSCLEQRRPKIPEKRNGDALPEVTLSPAAATATEAPRFALSASDAAAAIAASIADLTKPDSLHGGELEAIVRDGRIFYEPRRQR